MVATVQYSSVHHCMLQGIPSNSYVPCSGQQVIVCNNDKWLVWAIKLRINYKSKLKQLIRHGESKTDIVMSMFSCPVS